jgi:hypothetical protein
MAVTKTGGVRPPEKEPLSRALKCGLSAGLPSRLTPALAGTAIRIGTAGIALRKTGELADRVIGEAIVVAAIHRAVAVIIHAVPATTGLRSGRHTAIGGTRAPGLVAVAETVTAEEDRTAVDGADVAVFQARTGAVAAAIIDT